MTSPELDAWFVAEVLPLEASLMRFLRRNWPDPHETADLRQEVYARVYDGARRGPPLLAKPFVFATARNLLIDRVRRAQVVRIETVTDLEALHVPVDEVPADRRLIAREELKRLQAALDQLPPRCREVVTMRKVEGLSQREVARRMGITEDTVERQVSNGVRALAAALFGDRMAYGRRAGARRDAKEGPLMSEALHIEETAAGFLARRDGGAWTQADQAGLDAWLAQATAHRVAWLRLKAAWDRADRMGALNAPDAPPPSSVRRRHDLVMPTRIAAGLAGVLVLAGLGSLGLGLRSGPAAYRTEVGIRENVPLPDGSRVELNTDTRLRAKVSRDRRTVWLDRGEAYFEVAHDRLHPFVVFAGSRKVTVLGTRFSVRRDGDKVEVVVAEGRVRVDPIRPTATARAAVIVRDDVLVAAPTSTLVAQRTSQDVANALSWRQGAIVFDQTTLSEAAGEFNRYNAKRLVIADPAAGSRRIGGSFEANNVAGFARVLQHVFGLKVEEKGDEIVVSS